MSTPIIRMKAPPRTVIKGKMDVRFPASVTAESPILLDKTGGTFAFSFDMNAVIQSVTFAGFVSGPASAVDGNIPQFDGTTGKKLKDGKAAPTGDIVGTTDTQTLTSKTLTAPAISSPTGLVKADVGLGNVDNTSDATKNAATATLTHKTINAPDNTITNLATSMFAANVVDNDGTLAANSSTRIPTQAAVKAYADQVVAATDAMVFKGVIDCSANPNYPAADRGWTYKVSVAGKIGGASGVTVEAGDTLMCLTDGTAAGNQATVGANWNIVQANLVGAVTGPASSTSGRIATFNGTGGTVIQDGGKSIADLDTAAQTHAATSKTTPVDADELPLVDSAASNVLKKLTWANLKAAILALFNYAEGTWTPTLTFVTPGDLSVAYAAISGQTGNWTRIGNRVFIDFAIVSISGGFTHTTASGNLLITGLPIAANNNNGNAQRMAGLQWQGITKSGYTDAISCIENSQTYMTVRLSGSGVDNATVGAGDIPSGSGQVVLRGAGFYFV